MERLQRRALLDTASNPDGSIDYVTGVEGIFSFDDDGTCASVIVRYVPDRLILKPNTVEDYLSALESAHWETIEEVAVTLLGDLRNELVARWLQVTVKLCLTSAPLGHLSLFLNGGFGSSRFDVKPLVVDGSSGGF